MKQKKKNFLLLIAFILIAFTAYFFRPYDMQTAKNFLKETGYSSYYMRRLNMFKNSPQYKDSIVFLGDSITELLNLNELLPNKRINNRGISGDTAQGVLKRLSEVLLLRPRKLFLLIGTNDISYGVPQKEIADNIRQIITELQEKTPSTKIYVESLFPTNFSKFHRSDYPNSKITALNEDIKKIAAEKNCTFIDIHPLLLRDGELDENFTVDGLHLNNSANAKWLEFLAPYLDE